MFFSLDDEGMQKKKYPDLMEGRERAYIAPDCEEED